MSVCKECLGKGKEIITCNICKGEGGSFVYDPIREGRRWLDCSYSMCKGRGYWVMACPKCNGSGDSDNPYSNDKWGIW